MPNSRVFVSHSHHDNDYCREFVAALRERGYQVWYDEHNLGWGALRATIEKEMPQCQHFIAIFSPDAVASDWVNAEIDAALDLLKEGVMQTVTFVVARECVVPLLLRRWKRIEGDNNAIVPAQEAASRAVAILASTEAPALSPTPIARSRSADRLPVRLGELGFVASQCDGVAFIVPPICEVPTSEFLMGSDPNLDPQVRENELPQHRLTVASYAIGRFPVTVAEYACFVEGTLRRQPDDWEQQMQKVEHPIVSVSWDDAVAYAAWLAEQSGRPWRLPTEAEWEKAARWDAQTGTARLYPWGDSFDGSRANTRESRLGATTMVGIYPSGASPYGAEEMAGNVWEWTHSIYKSYPYNGNDGRELAQSPEHRVLRGGSWLYDAWYSRAAFRSLNRPSDLETSYVGFRLLLAAVGP